MKRRIIRHQAASILIVTAALLACKQNKGTPGEPGSVPPATATQAGKTAPVEFKAFGVGITEDAAREKAEKRAETKENVINISFINAPNVCIIGLFEKDLPARQAVFYQVLGPKNTMGSERMDPGTNEFKVCIDGPTPGIYLFKFSIGPSITDAPSKNYAPIRVTIQ